MGLSTPICWGKSTPSATQIGTMICICPARNFPSPAHCFICPVTPFIRELVCMDMLDARMRPYG